MVLGAIGTVALGSPASATNSKVSYELECGKEPGTVVIAWTVENEVRNKDAVVGNLNRTLDGIADGQTIKAKESATGTEVVNVADNEKVELKLTLKWGHGEPVWVGKTADLTKIECKPQPKVDFTDNCDGTVLVKVTNTGKDVVKIAVNGKGEFVERKEIAPGETWEVTVPADNAEHVRVKYPGGEQIADHHWAKPDVCYSVKHESTCDELIITVTNEGAKALKASVAVGDDVADTVIEPGDTHEIKLDAAAGLVVTLTVAGKSSEIKYAEPDDCTPLLPVTGVNAGLLAGAALVLVSGGAGLFFVARRRRIRFAA
jgi:hypothetical protein